MKNRTNKRAGKKTGDDQPQKLLKFGSYLAERRSSARKTQYDVASELVSLKVSQGRVAHYEKGRVTDPKPNVLRAFASLYDIDFITLVVKLAREKYASPTRTECAIEEMRWDLIEASAVGSNRMITFPRPPESLQISGKKTLVGDKDNGIDILDVDGIAQWQRSITTLKEFWVVAPNFLDDKNDAIRAAVVSNIRKRVRYVYFLDHDGYYSFKKLRDLLRNELSQATDASVLSELNKLTLAYRLPVAADIWLHSDYIIAHYDDDRKTIGFQNLRHEGKTSLAIRIHESDLSPLVKAIGSYMGRDESKIDQEKGNYPD